MLSTVVSGIFLVTGAAAVYVMMAKMGRKETPHPDRSTRLHRWLGWIFVILFLVMFVFMLERIEG
jgi:hypothetical protein